MNKYEIMTQYGIVIIEAENFSYNENDLLFYIKENTELRLIALFKNYNHVINKGEIIK